MGGIGRVNEAEPLFVSDGASGGSHESPVDQRVSSKEGVYDVARVRQAQAPSEIHVKQFVRGAPDDAKRIVLARFDVGLRFVGLNRSLHVVHDGPVACECEVIVPRVAHIPVLPRVQFDGKRRHKRAIFVTNGSSCAPHGEVACSGLLQHEHHSVGAVGVGGAKVHGELQVDVRFKVDPTVVPGGTSLILGCLGQTNAIVREQLRPLHQVPLGDGGKAEREAQPHEEQQAKHVGQTIEVLMERQSSCAKRYLSAGYTKGFKDTSFTTP